MKSRMKDKKHIANLSDSDFMAFLYSERERENNLSEFHGWNNWALAGAIVTVFCSGYAILKANPTFDVTKVLYNTVCLVTFFLTYHSWTSIFRKKRGVDFSKVKMVKEVIPFVKIVFVCVFGIASLFMIAIFDRCSSVFWLWVSVIIVYTTALIVSLWHKEKVVPSFSRDMTLPWIGANNAYESLMGGVFSIIMTLSFKKAGRQLISPEFEIAACIAAILVLFFILFKLNYGNIVVRRFDAIIDKYLYAGATKEETFQEILKNRMGYSVLDACYKELQSVEKQTKLCVEEEKELTEIKKYILDDKLEIEKLHEFQARIDEILDNQEKTLKLSKALLDRLNEIVRVLSSFNNIAEMECVFDTNQQCYEKVEAVSNKLSEVSRMVNEAEKRILTEINTALKREIQEKKDLLRVNESCF